MEHILTEHTFAHLFNQVPAEQKLGEVQHGKQCCINAVSASSTWFSIWYT